MKKLILFLAALAILVKTQNTYCMKQEPVDKTGNKTGDKIECDLEIKNMEHEESVTKCEKPVTTSKESVKNYAGVKHPYTPESIKDPKKEKKCKKESLKKIVTAALDSLKEDSEIYVTEKFAMQTNDLSGDFIGSVLVSKIFLSTTRYLINPVFLEIEYYSKDRFENLTQKNLKITRPYAQENLGKELTENIEKLTKKIFNLWYRQHHLRSELYILND